MDDQDYIFKPKYPFLKKNAVIGLHLLFIILVVFGLLDQGYLPDLFWVGLLLLALITSLVPYFFIREIRFTQNFVVRRQFLPDRFLELEEIKNIDPNFIYLKDSRIRLGGLTNGDELQARFQRWKSASILKGLPQKTAGNLTLFPIRGTGNYAFMWSLFIGIVALVIQPAWITLDTRWFFGIIFLAVYFIHIYLLPKVI